MPSTALPMAPSRTSSLFTLAILAGTSSTSPMLLSLRAWRSSCMKQFWVKGGQALLERAPPAFEVEHADNDMARSGRGRYAGGDDFAWRHRPGAGTRRQYFQQAVGVWWG